jgi:hypothetical protein
MQSRLDKSVYVALNGTLEFGEHVREKFIFLPHSALPLRNVHLALFAEPDPHTGEMVEDVRCYFGKIDITADIISDIQRQLNRIDRPEKATHVFAESEMDAFQASTLSTDYLPSREEIASFESLGCTKDRSRSSLFGKIFRNIPLEPISFNRLPSLSRFPFEKLPSRGQRLRLAVNATRATASMGSGLRGRVSYAATVELGAPTDDILQEIDDLVTAIYAKLSPNGDVYQAVTGSSDTLESISALLDKCDAIVGSDSDIKSVSESLKEIKQVLNITP